MGAGNKDLVNLDRVRSVLFDVDLNGDLLLCVGEFPAFPKRSDGGCVNVDSLTPKSHLVLGGVLLTDS